MGPFQRSAPKKLNFCLRFNNRSRVVFIFYKTILKNSQASLNFYTVYSIPIIVKCNTYSIQKKNVH